MTSAMTSPRFPTQNRSKPPSPRRFATGNGIKERDTKRDRPPDPILFQTWFKSVGPRTYAAQIRRARNGNQYLVLTEGNRDKQTDEVRKTSLYVFSEDFQPLFHMLREAAQWIRSNPLSPDLVSKRQKFWQKRSDSAPRAA
jgi:hypothetical protein